MLIAGMSAFFPPPPWNVTPLPRNPSGEEKSRMAGLVAVHAREVSAARARPAWCLLLFACLRKQQAEAPPAMARFTHALMHWLAAQPCVSSLIVTSDADATAEPASSSLGPSLPRALGLPPMQVGAVQRSLREWLLLELRMEAEQGLKEEGPATGQPPRTPSACQQLMASLAQELLARASLVSKGKVAMDEPDTVRLLELAEQLLASATGLLAALPTQHGAALEAQQASIGATYLGSLLPWVVDCLTLFSLFGFDFAFKLLPVLLPLLEQLQRLLSSHARRASLGSTAPESTPPIPFESGHPYKRGAQDEKKKKGWGRGRAEEGKEMELKRYEERHAWPGATQLTLKFDQRCCGEEGDWLTVSFYKGQAAVPGETRRYCGGWESWPKAPLTVLADTLVVEWSHRRTSLLGLEHFGYAFTVVASRKGGAVRERTPPLQQLQRSLVYLGAKYAGLLVCAEPVTNDERQHRHWLTSPLFARGLPLQMPAEHGLMHPFFGIQVAGYHPFVSKI